MSDSSESDNVLCLKCGKENDPDARFCKHCAFDLTLASTAPATHTTNEAITPTRNRLPLVLSLLSLVLVVVVLGLVLLRRDNSNQATNSSTSNPPSSYAPPSTVTPDRASTTPSSVASTPATVSSDSGSPSERDVEAAVRKAFEKFKREGRTDTIPGIQVEGIQELPGQSGAKADLNLTNAAFLQDDLLRGQWEVGPGGVGGRMVYPKKRIRIENGSAMLKRYNNGRWVLESIDTQTYEFGTIRVNIGL